MGDPSRGLLQTIMATFLAYHWPGTSGNIYDPLANIAAAINYARHVYGPNLMSGGSGLGSGHGYASGTSSALPGWAVVGERGAELVKFRGGEQVTPLHGRGGGRPGRGVGTGHRRRTPRHNDLLAQLIGVTAQGPAVMGAALAGGARSATYKALYS